ncbi:MAG: thioesterase family protein [Actinomycetota bacterium]|nr:thioesterase family protein [Actinomycetota bacterium]
MTKSYFTIEERGFMPGEQAAGPWSPDMLHGRFVGGLAAREIEREFVEDGWRVSRLTVDMFRPGGIELVTISPRLIRSGRRIKVVDVSITAGDHTIGGVRAVILAEGEEPEGDVWHAPMWESPDPETLGGIPEADAAVQSSVWEFRVHQGGIRSGDRSRVWTNDHGALVDGESMSPLVRAAVSADLASPLANGNDDGVAYINADYTLAMARYPVGAWIGHEATTHLANSGIAVGATTMYDEEGPFATSTTTALVNPGLS